jgi:hypothetical protein
MVPLPLLEVKLTKRTPSISYLKRSWLQRLGWHIRAYVPVIGIMALVGVSLGVLHLHRLLSQLFVKEVKSISVTKEEFGVRGN